MLIGSQVLQVSDALQRMRVNAAPWLKWHIDRILTNMAEHPNGRGAVFDTGLTNQLMYYRILDIGEYAQTSEMLTQVGDLIMKNAPAEIQKRANTLKYVLMIITITLMLVVYGGTISIIDDFKEQVTLKSATMGS
jgi:hypothetical protein